LLQALSGPGRGVLDVTSPGMPVMAGGLSFALLSLVASRAALIGRCLAATGGGVDGGPESPSIQPAKANGAQREQTGSGAGHQIPAFFSTVDLLCKLGGVSRHPPLRPATSGSPLVLLAITIISEVVR